MHILSIGSAVIDLFLDIDPDHVKTLDKNVSFELGDKIPSTIKKTAIGGNGANVAVGLSRLEIPTTFYTYLGNDFLSREIIDGLSQNRVELDIERHDDTPSKSGQATPPLHIILDFPEDRVILANYGVAEHDFKPRNIDFEYIFLTSIPEKWEGAYNKILEFSKTNNIPLAFSPGTRQIEEKNDLVVEVLKQTKIYFSNRDEAEKIAGKQADVKELLSHIKSLGPEIVSITDGDRGAYAIDSTNTCYFMDPSPSDGHEKTGAGDAYASAFFASILYGKNIQTAMRWGTLNAGGVMKHIGAQTGLLTKQELDDELKVHNNLTVKTL